MAGDNIIAICENCNVNMVLTSMFGNSVEISELPGLGQVSFMCPNCGNKTVILCVKE